MPVFFNAMPYKKRFWIYPENRYTETELAFRQQILLLRAQSRLDKDYLSHAGSWFSSDERTAFNTHNSHAWFLAKTLEPREKIRREHFLVQPVDGLRLQWQVLYELMQNVGDYLLIRNAHLPEQHLNQPMNYMLLDLIHILKGLSQNPHISQTIQQLVFLNDYLHQVEKVLSKDGSDRLFLSICRGQIVNMVEPWLNKPAFYGNLKEQLVVLSKHLRALNHAYYRVLHFAFNSQEINPHVYDMDINARDALSLFPVAAVKACIRQNTERNNDGKAKCISETLHIENKEALKAYEQAMSAVNELQNFRIQLDNGIKNFNQVGERLFLSKERLSLLKALSTLPDTLNETQGKMNHLIALNTKFYHDVMVKVPRLTFWQKHIKGEDKPLNQFLYNQELLSHYPATTTALVPFSIETKDILVTTIEQLRILNQSSIENQIRVKQTLILANTPSWQKPTPFILATLICLPLALLSCFLWKSWHASEDNVSNPAPAP